MIWKVVSEDVITKRLTHGAALAPLERKEVYSDLGHNIACRAKEKTHTYTPYGPEEKEQPVDRGATDYGRSSLQM
jgi:hypothetical protein